MLPFASVPRSAARLRLLRLAAFTAAPLLDRCAVLGSAAEEARTSAAPGGWDFQWIFIDFHWIFMDFLWISDDFGPFQGSLRLDLATCKWYLWRVRAEDLRGQPLRQLFAVILRIGYLRAKGFC